MGGGRRGGRESYARTRDGGEEAYQKDHSRQKMLQQEKPKVFTSFSMNDENQVNLWRQQIKDSDKLDIKDTSLKEPFDEKWKTQTREIIKDSDVMIVFIGEDTSGREAVKWEIETAKEEGVPVRGVRIYSDKNHKVPESMKEDKDKVGKWDLDEIQDDVDKMKKERKENEENGDNS